MLNKIKIIGLCLVFLILTACGGSHDTATPQQETIAASEVSEMAASLPIHTETASVPVFEPSKENKQIAENFCYAVHAVGNCNDLIMRMDTQEKVENMINDANLGTPKSPYSDACLSGLVQAQEDKNLCSNAWKRFGCGGNTMPNLIQQSSSSNANPILCKFNG